jgi:ubiquitin carboxyl-terminal hydrolase 8
MQKTIVTCDHCGKPSITYNPFMTLSVAFESSLEKCISNYLKEDTLGSKDKYKCEKCGMMSKAKIKTELSKLPNILVFHLKRFSFPSLKKIKGNVKYSSYLKMKKY